MPLAAAMIAIAFLGGQRRAPERRRPERGKAEAALQHAAPRQRVIGSSRFPLQR